MAGWLKEARGETKGSKGSSEVREPLAFPVTQTNGNCAFNQGELQLCDWISKKNEWLKRWSGMALVPPERYLASPSTNDQWVSSLWQEQRQKKIVLETRERVAWGIACCLSGLFFVFVSFFVEILTYFVQFSTELPRCLLFPSLFPCLFCLVFFFLQQDWGPHNLSFRQDVSDLCLNTRSPFPSAFSCSLTPPCHSQTHQCIRGQQTVFFGRTWFLLRAEVPWEAMLC